MNALNSLWSASRNGYTHKNTRTARYKAYYSSHSCDLLDDIINHCCGRCPILVLVKWFLLAMQFGTIIPTPVVNDTTERDIRCSVVFFPVIGLLLGGVLWGSQFLCTRYLSNLAATGVSIVFYTVCTGALHLDGLMDTADAIGSRRPRETALEIMKDSRIGAMGAVAVVLVLIGKFAAVSTLNPGHPVPFLVVPMLSRLSMVWSMALSPSARSEGLGYLFAKRVPISIIVAATAFSAVICLISLSGFAYLWAVLYFFVPVILFNTWMRHRFGGTTGDTYGAMNEIMEWLGFMVFSAIGLRA